MYSNIGIFKTATVTLPGLMKKNQLICKF